MKSPRRLETAPDDDVRANRLGEKQDFFRVAEGDPLIANRHVVANDHNPVIEAVSALNQHRDPDVDGTWNAAVDSQDVVGCGVYPDAAPCGDMPRPVEAVVVAAGVSAVLTPPDVVSMLLMLVPLYALYEFAILAIRLTHWRAARRAAGSGQNLGPKTPPGGGEGWRFRAHFVG